MPITPNNNPIYNTYPPFSVHAFNINGGTVDMAVDTGINVMTGQLLKFQAGGAVRPWPPINGDYGYTNPWGYPTLRAQPPLLPSDRFMSLIGAIGSPSSAPTSGFFKIGAQASFPAPATGRLWLYVNDVPNTFGDNDGTFGVIIQVERRSVSQPPVVTLPPIVTPPGPSTCSASTYHGAFSSHPINLRDAEKVLVETDFSLNTPAGPLTFSRIYRQHQRENPDFQTLLGLGWTHNHAIQLTISGSSFPRAAQVRWSEGSLLLLDEVSSGVFQAQPSSTAVMEYTDTDEFTLRLEDRSTYVFQLDGSVWELVERRWDNGEVWSYTYDVDHRLTNVSDGYGRSLQLSYIDNSAFDEGLIWRVGDQTASGLDGGSPTGRFVEFTYTQERSNGSVVTNARPLLASVEDVHGNTWAYDYYGQDSGESDAELLNLLTETRTPSVDTTGDGSVDGSLITQRLAYTFDSDPVELAVNGGMENDSDWTDIEDAEPTTHERSTTQVNTGTYSRHVVAANADEGIEGNGWELFKDRQYTITARVYVVSGEVQMRVAATDVFTRTSTSTGAWETLSASAVVSDTSDDLCHLQFVAWEGAAEFYVDTVSIVEENPLPVSIVQELGLVDSDPALLTKTFVFQPDRAGVTTETLDGQVTTHHFVHGVYQGTANPTDQMSVAKLDETYRSMGHTDSNGNITSMTWSADGQHLEKVVDALNYETGFVYDAAGRLHRSTDATGHHTVYLYEDPAQPRLPTRVLVMTPDNLALDGGMEIDDTGMSEPYWRDISGAEPLVNERADGEVDTGSFARHVETDAADEGIESRDFDLLTGQTYLITARVYPVVGTARMTVSDNADFIRTSSGTEAWETFVAVYTPTFDQFDVHLRFLADGDAAEFYVSPIHWAMSLL